MSQEAGLSKCQGLTPGGRFASEVALRWADTDAFHHLNNVVYFRLMEEARVQLFLRTGLSLPKGRVPVLASASCDFLKPMFYPGTAKVSLTLVRVGRSSMEVAVEIGRTDEAAAYATGRNVIVWMDSESGKSEPWPLEFLEALGERFASAP